MNQIATSPNAKKEVVRLDVSMKVALVVEVLYTIDHLVRYHQYRLHRELSFAKAKQYFERRAKQLLHHNMKPSLISIPVDTREPRPTLKRVDDSCLLLKLWVTSVLFFKLDGYIFLSLQLFCYIDLTKRALAKFLADFVL
jgi:hypothetical protein